MRHRRCAGGCYDGVHAGSVPWWRLVPTPVPPRRLRGGRRLVARWGLRTHERAGAPGTSRAAPATPRHATRPRARPPQVTHTRPRGAAHGVRQRCAVCARSSAAARHPVRHEPSAPSSVVRRRGRCHRRRCACCSPHHAVGTRTDAPGRREDPSALLCGGGPARNPVMADRVKGPGIGRPSRVQHFLAGRSCRRQREERGDGSSCQIRQVTGVTDETAPRRKTCPPKEPTGCGGGDGAAGEDSISIFGSC